jgi:hypothetical protein
MFLFVNNIFQFSLKYLNTLYFRSIIAIQKNISNQKTKDKNIFNYNCFFNEFC